MNTKQNNKLVSYAATEAVLKANPEIASVPGLPGKLVQLSAKIGEIHMLARIQNQPLAVTTARRDQIFEAMAESALAVAAAVANVAQERAITDLMQAVRVVPSSFQASRRAQRVWLAQRVHDAAGTALEHLEPYGVTAEALAALQERIAAATAAIHMPRTAVTTRKAATHQLAELIREVDALLVNGIDRLVLRLRRSQPQFYKDYRATRQVVDWRGARRPGDAPLLPAAPETPVTPVTPATPVAPTASPADQHIAA